ncbi:MAG: AbrB/MazE/SpoVT family DNA-binding domain-containing protein [Candidatus Dormibacteraeota bacterium]|nr:AbrB/MazE/SpoVT family DNA-binding domain-containing protein [Candidatus Dormibacteraeota bacterium]
MAHTDAFKVQLDDRGRLLLPAEVRQRLKLRQGDELVVTVQPDLSLRVVSKRQLVRGTRGLYRARTNGRSLVDELIAERQEEAKLENSSD